MKSVSETTRCTLPPIARSSPFRLTAAITALLITAATHAQAQPTITNLGTVSGYSAISHPKVSANGLVVAGSAIDNSQMPPVFRAVRWTRSGGAVSLGLPADATNDINVHSRGVNADGSVVVVDTDGLGGFFWTDSSGFSTVLSGDISFSSVDGTGTTAVGTFRGFIETDAVRVGSNGVVNSLGVNSFGSEGTGISGNGNVAVGWARVGNFRTAFRSTGPGVFEFLGRLPGQSQSIPNAVNNDGSVIVGTSGLANTGPGRAFRWSISDGLQDLGTLSGDNWSEALAVTGDGTLAVGFSTVYLVGQRRAFLWSDMSGMVDLNTYLPTIGVDLGGWTLTSATGISSDGSVIVGEGFLNGTSTSWIVSGVPAPGAASLLAVSCVFASRRRRSPQTCSMDRSTDSRCASLVSY